MSYEDYEELDYENLEYENDYGENYQSYSPEDGDYSPDRGDEDEDEDGDYSPDEDEEHGNSPLYEEDYDMDGYDPSDYGRTGGGSFSGDNFGYMNARDIILSRMHGILKSVEYSEFSKEIKINSTNIIENIPEKKVILYSIDVLVPVALYMAQYKDQLSKNNVTEFIKKTSGLKTINHLDFIRYARIVKNLKKDGILVY